MSLFHKITRWVKAGIARFLKYLPWRASPYKTLVVEGDLPKQLHKQTLYLVREDGFWEQAAMLCPCGCGKILHMNLLADERPVWTVVQHEDGTASLHPSVWRQKDCKSHFWLKRGYVIWAQDVKLSG